MSDGAPKFLQISDERHYHSLTEALSVLWETEPRVNPLRLNSPHRCPRERRAVPAVFTSLLLHFAVGYFFYSVPVWLLLLQLVHPYQPPPEPDTTVVYKLDEINLADYLPVQKPADSGAVPGRGAITAPRAPFGSARRDPRVQVVSNPPNPDNFKQTILQPNTPPKLTIPRDIPLPNLILGSVALPPEPPKPAPPKLPSPAEVPVQAPHPVVAKAAPPVPPDLALVPKFPPLQSPALEVPAPPAPAPTVAKPASLPASPSDGAMKALTASAEPSAAPPSGASGASGGSTKLVSLSLNPIPLGRVIALPPGNRLGAFAIADGSTNGSPGGVASSETPAGNTGKGPGGDASLAAGVGGAGGGGAGDAASNGLHSVTGDARTAGLFTSGTLPPLPPEKLVYPVDEAVSRLRRPSLVVSSGGGGGGLEVYGVLHGRKIYTIYLPMPGKNWILQFCAEKTSAGTDPATHVVQIQMEPLLVPPTAIDQFDFHRPDGTSPKPNAMIILHGSILEDGSVGKLQILKGIGDVIDEAAEAAFARWKFTPALRAGNPVAVEILVGIPALVPGS